MGDDLHGDDGCFSEISREKSDEILRFCILTKMCIGDTYVLKKEFLKSSKRFLRFWELK